MLSLRSPQLRFAGTTRELVKTAAKSSDKEQAELPKLVRDLRVAYELILDNKHTRLRVMEVAQAIKEVRSDESYSPLFSVRSRFLVASLPSELSSLGTITPLLYSNSPSRFALTLVAGRQCDPASVQPRGVEGRDSFEPRERLSNWKLRQNRFLAAPELAAAAQRPAALRGGSSQGAHEDRHQPAGQLLHRAPADAQQHPRKRRNAFAAPAGKAHEEVVPGNPVEEGPGTRHDGGL